MANYGFFMQHRDIATHHIPAVEYIEAETVRQAIMEICRKHDYKPESFDDYELWVTLKDGRNVSYTIEKRDNNGFPLGWILPE